MIFWYLAHVVHVHLVHVRSILVYDIPLYQPDCLIYLKAVDEAFRTSSIIQLAYLYDVQMLESDGSFDSVLFECVEGT